MKNLITALIVFLCSLSMYSQTEEDYESTLDLISTSFNEKKPSLIYQKFNSDLKKQLEEDVFKKMLDSLSKEKGNISSYEFIMEEGNEKSYLTEFEHASMLILLHLTPDGQISVFSIKDY